MEDAFNKLKNEGKTDVESLIKWLQESKVIGESKAIEEKARALFSEAANKQSVELQHFKEALGKLAEEQEKNVDDLAKRLAELGPRLYGAIVAGASAFSEAWYRDKEPKAKKVSLPAIKSSADTRPSRVESQND